MKQLPFLMFCLIGTFFFTNGQQRFGGNKQAEKWKQLNDGTVRVIFPERLDSIAIRVAGIAELLKNSTSSTIGSRQRKINIVLQPFTTVSNAYVGLGPFRSEFFMTPRQNSFELGTLPWADNLVIHEYRHVQQYNNFDVGLSRLLGIIFGENGRALANSLAIPNWFWEGDAVHQETLVSEQGRGRLSFFYNDFRSLWQANKNYDWMKLRNGSLRDFVPDHYRLGYLQVAYARQQYGNDFWRKVTRDAASFKGVLYPFQKAIKKETGISYSNFRIAALRHFKKQFTDTLSTRLKSKHFIADKEFPAYATNNAMIYVKSSYRQVPAFVELKDGVERKIRTRDVSLDNQFSYKNGKIVYASYRPDMRWSWNDYSELQLLDIVTGRQQTITRKTKYFSPDISDNGKSIIAVDVRPGGSSTLHIVNAIDGIVEKVLPNESNYFYTYPKWLTDTSAVAAVRGKTGQMALVKINTLNGEEQLLTPFSWRVLGFPTIKGDSIYFTASNGADDQLCAYLLSTNEIYQLDAKNKAIGIYQPTVSGNELSYTTFTANGYMLQQEDIGGLFWKQLTAEEWQIVNNKFVSEFDKENAKSILAAVSKDAAPLSAYSKSSHLFNFHSLYPLVNDPEYSLSAIGENILNTLQSELFFTYNRNEKFKQAGFNAVYGQWFPYLTLGTNYTFDRSDLLNDSSRIYWNEAQLVTGISVPLNLSKGRSYTRLNAGSNLIYNKPFYRGFYKDSVQDGSFGYLNNFIVFSHQIQQAKQHILPRLAQTITINYRNGIIRRTARQLNANASFYFPGLHVNHNFVVNLAIGLRDSLRQVSFSNSFPFSRGYTARNLYRMSKWAVNYHFPLFYPDKGFGNIVYLLRVRANAFYDHTVGNVAFRNNQTNQLFRRDVDFRSAGTEIFFDTKWWNELPLSIGIRYSRLLDTDLFGTGAKNRFELILPVNLVQR
jgi:hypothetical protein